MLITTLWINKYYLLLYLVDIYRRWLHAGDNQSMSSWYLPTKTNRHRHLKKTYVYAFPLHKVLSFVPVMLALPKQGLKKLSKHSELFLSTEIFSKRRKIYAIWRETRVCSMFAELPAPVTAAPDSLMVALYPQEVLPAYCCTRKSARRLLIVRNVELRRKTF